MSDTTSVKQQSTAAFYMQAVASFMVAIAAVAFASGFGFRPTAERRQMRVRSEDDEDEVAMVLALGGDRGSAPVDF